MRAKLFSLSTISIVLAVLISCTPVEQKESIVSSSSSVSSQASEVSQASQEEQSHSESSAILKYHVIFLNYDETCLYETDVKSGEEAIYKGEEPTREEDDDYTYIFKGWDKDLSNIQSDLTTKAQYEQKSKWTSLVWF